MMIFGRLAIRLGAYALISLSLAHAETRLVAAVANVNEDMLPILTAEKKGYFKEAGLTVELQNFKGGGPAVQALVSGAADLCLCAADHVLRLRARRLPATVLVGIDNFHAYVLVAKVGSPYTDLKSLVGKRIGVTSSGSLTDNTIRWSIGKLGMNPARDYEIVPAGTGATMRAALESGQVDAGLLATTDAVAILRTPNGYKIIADYRDIPYPSFDVLALVSWIASHREAARGFHDALVHAIADLNTDPALATAVIREMYPTLDEAAARDVARNQIARMPRDGDVPPEAIKNLNEIVTAADDSLRPVPAQDVYDPTLIAR